MRASNFLTILSLVVATTFLATSCVEKNTYEIVPANNNHNNNNNGNNGGYSYVFDEEFNGRDLYGWTFASSSDSAYASISNGSYQYVDYSYTKFNTSFVNTNANTTGNFTVQTKMQANNTMGLIFGASSTDYGYAFYLDTLGYFSLYKEGIGSIASTVIIPSTQDTLYAIKKGWNTLEVDQVNGNWTGFINGTQVFQMTARSVSGSGFGFKIAPATIGYADYIIIKSN